MRQEARFLLAITLMIVVLVGTNMLFPPVPPEEVSGPEGVAPGQLDGTGVAGVPGIPPGDPVGGTDTGGGAAVSGDDRADPFGRQPVTEPSTEPSPFFAP